MGVHAIEAVDRVASRTEAAFVAARGIIVEIKAPRPLHEVAADGGHVAHLPQASCQHRSGQHGKLCTHQRMGSQFGVPHRRHQ